MAGAAAADLPVVIESAAINIKHYGFALPNGDKMVALRTDGVAVEEDPGVITTLILPGFSSQRITGIDVLNGFQQEMITEVENDSLVIRNLMVQDYPTILRISSTPVGILTEGLKGPAIYKLGNNYPNPFNPETTFHYQLPKKTHVSIEIYNIKGQLVVSLVDEKLEAGYYSVQWGGRSNSEPDNELSLEKWTPFSNSINEFCPLSNNRSNSALKRLDWLYSISYLCSDNLMFNRQVC
jgi:hypothetical protein